MKQSLFLFITFLSSLVLAQTDFNNYQTIQSKGEIPQDFYLLSSEKVSQEIDENDKFSKEFITKTRFGIDELLHSGKVVFNDELSNYVRDVAKKLLKKDKETFNKLRFYTYKSRVTNAFSTDQGIIFVTTGLLSQIENEAQLAVVLAHEITHFTENHVHEAFMEEKNYKNRGGFFNQDQKLIQLSTYSREKEYEADLKGAELYLSSGYATSELLSSFDILLYSYLPFDEKRFDTAFFNTPLMKIPGMYFSDTIATIRAIDDQDDSKSTHPNVKKRRAKIEEFVAEKPNKGATNLVSKDRFNNVRNIARFETMRMSLIQRDYSRCVYEIFLLKKDFPESKYLDLCLAKVMYGLTVYKNKYQMKKVSDKLKDVEGEQFQVNYLFKKLSREQLSIVALRTAQDLYIKYYPDTEFRNYRDWILEEILRKGLIDFESMKDVTFDSYLQTQMDPDTVDSNVVLSDTMETVDPEDAYVSKYDRIKSKKGSKGATIVNEDGLTITEEDFHLFALSDLITDKKFKELLDKLEPTDDNAYSSYSDTRQTREQRRKGAQLGIKHVLVFDPIIQFAHHRKKQERGYEDSEAKKLEYLQEIREYANEIGIKTSVLDSKSLNRSDVDKFNALATIKEWIIEVAMNESVSIKSALNKEIDELQKEFNFDYIFLPYVESEQQMFVSYGGPFGFVPRRSRKVYTTIGGVVLDVNESQVHYAFHKRKKGKPKYNEISAHLYDMLNQIKSVAPKK